MTQVDIGFLGFLFVLKHTSLDLLFSHNQDFIWTRFPLYVSAEVLLVQERD